MRVDLSQTMDNATGSAPAPSRAVAGIDVIDERHHRLGELSGIGSQVRPEMGLAPTCGMLSHDVERAGLWELMGRAWYDLDYLRRRQACNGLRFDVSSHCVVELTHVNAISIGIM